MAEEKQKTKEETKMQESEKKENKTETKKIEEKQDKAEKKETKKIEVKKVKKDYALVNGLDLAISTKDGMHICDMIRGRNIETAMKMVEEVIAFKRPVKMTTREYPHQHGKGIAGASFPIKAAAEFLRLLKNLKANAIYNELELEKCILVCKADKASKPYRRGGTRFKRSHLMLKLIKKEEKKK